MAWRLQFSTGKHYIDFEGGKRQVVTAEPEQDSAPQMNDTPLHVYTEPLGFRIRGNGGEFATEIEG